MAATFTTPGPNAGGDDDWLLVLSSWARFELRSRPGRARFAPAATPGRRRPV